MLSVSAREQPISLVVSPYKLYILCNYCMMFLLSRAIPVQIMNFENRATNFLRNAMEVVISEPVSAAGHIYNLPTLSANATKLEVKVSREKSCTFSK